MSNFVPGERGAILSIAGKIDHLHVLCTRQFFDPTRGRMSVVGVNVSSIKEGCMYDSTCVLQEGDHPFIKHSSYVRYQDAVAIGVDSILAGIETGEITVLQEFSSTVFQRVLDGFGKSEKTPRKILKILRHLEQIEGNRAAPRET